ncbi:bifunctional UDP-N-acetylglucosamine pyrophosphorylase/glucosamine-1-phosphate N-acetyltransferase [Arcanobacterium wilhelmae]|uniref:Bifunctional UDP-N-acetylglucosamine pyrophosphorylase/glucosamine-1-phosphate N-acetyltransferase n=1 Tax=Arcanobacterium wilhelmae TaxID=1803177 RepID=A0ABT9NDE6_9ACTO|nr:NTP transferase domain-containing protein [Arcanobacterium wilhelmae]MDP9801216.1 bifunctional UDP-N-acetylglucosamine pyrophosphorylase/glucosamine-1-phosphate N-acetyltransferase [Arcanobacterium wilhelmae]WFN90566.1 NTP transferase domain-containing protein [Arcanobacterium wilhelmae]
MAKLSAAIVLAAGKGTRIKSSIPKVLLRMNGRSLVGHMHHAVAGLEPDHEVFVVRHERERVVEHLGEIAPNALIADQDDVKGTGRAAWCGLQALPADLEGAVLIVAGDSPMFTTEALADLLAAHGENAVTVLSTRVPDPDGYGRIMRDSFPGSSEVAGTPEATGPIVGIVEEKDATDLQRTINEIGTSTYIFDAKFLRESLGTLGTDNAQGEMYLTDLIAKAAETGVGVGSFVLEDSIQAEGVNDLVQLATLRAEKNRRILEHWMRTGVHIIDPATTHVGCEVTLEPDAVVEPGTVLSGTTHIGAFAHVGPHSQLENVEVGAGARLAHVVASNVTVKESEQVPPFTVLGGATE